ncbi:aldo/keto reductase [Fulvimarina sp. 2208YS6-2-32]|uniref:Aldo/keto reductase n=1 Tax=Fulvimarina uroteuthidis TaxID=3098149 RepID=A0ABU5I3A7_9HYPH|nr:aldo/keto reductase [Fulvimarina sp. 2208YS6-2-32]MDY8108666.1 aldo/keto reductase [Fulvimarina sp. 2208YS6-2-32]
MKKRSLGRTGLSVSELCLGTMTFGSQNTEAEAHQQLDRAVERGVDFLDAAEMYPTTPMKRETVGRTEEYVGTWLKKPSNREKVVVATKITGEGSAMVRDGAKISRQTLTEAIEGSLRRLQIDEIDLYQLHWPNRGSYHFRKSWDFDPSTQDADQAKADMLEILETIADLQKAGKLKHFGLSNETAWGTTRFCTIAETSGLPRPVSIQNEYSLMCRYFDLDMAETALHEDVGLLSYSSLAAGILTGKYSGGHIPEGSRGSINSGLGGRLARSNATVVADEYVKIARKHGLEPAQLAYAFCLTRPFLTSVIIGATSMEQLDVALGSADITLSDAVMDEIAEVYRHHPVPM